MDQRDDRSTDRVVAHYQGEQTPESLLARVEDLLRQAEHRLTPADLAGLDQFHIRGLAATQELAELAGVAVGWKVLDAGSGLGGPSRFLASTYGCQVVGVDLTPAFVRIAILLADYFGVAEHASYQQGDLLALPFPSGSFDLVWTQHVVMNIADRSRLYRELRRVLKPGGKLAFYDVIAGESGWEPHFPVPWAESADASHLLDEAETREVLARSDLSLMAWRDVTEASLQWLAEARGASKPGISLAMVMGPRMAEMSANLRRNLQEGRIRVVMGVCQA